jgi:hypothetical protein
MSEIAISRSITESMLRRGRTLMVQAVLNEAGLLDPQRMYAHWQGFANCAASLLSPAANAMALHDQASDPQCLVEAALARLPDNSERLCFADMKRLMAAQGIHHAPNSVAHCQVDAVIQLQNGMGVVVETNDEHAVAGIDVGDGSNAHSSPKGGEVTIVAQGGAA